MADGVKLQLCILWEDELRAAARLLRKASDLNEAGAPEEDISDAMTEAYTACMAALWGLKDDYAAVVMASGEIKRFAQKKQQSEEINHG